MSWIWKNWEITVQRLPKSHSTITRSILLKIFWSLKAWITFHWKTYAKPSGYTEGLYWFQKRAKDCIKCFLICKRAIYPSSFTDVRFWKKIKFPNVMFHEKRSQNYPTMRVGVLRHCKLCRRSMATEFRGQSLDKIVGFLRLKGK